MVCRTRSTSSSVHSGAARAAGGSRGSAHREGRERTEIARTIGELQAQVARDQQEMGFYRGWCPARPAGGRCGARAAVSHRDVAGDQHFSLRFSLSRTQRPEEAVNGTIAITIDGTSNGSSSSIDLPSSPAARASCRSISAILPRLSSRHAPGDFKPITSRLKFDRDAKRGTLSSDVCLERRSDLLMFKRSDKLADGQVDTLIGKSTSVQAMWNFPAACTLTGASPAVCAQPRVSRGALVSEHASSTAR